MNTWQNEDYACHFAFFLNPNSVVLWPVTAKSCDMNSSTFLGLLIRNLVCMITNKCRCV